MKDGCKVQEADDTGEIFQVGNACVIIKEPKPLPSCDEARGVLRQWQQAGWDILREKHLR